MKNCKNCLIIRYFIFSVIIIVIFGLLFTDKLNYLSFVNPLHFSYLILFIGLSIFLIKLMPYLLKLLNFNKSNKIGNSARKSSKSMSSKKIN